VYCVVIIAEHCGSNLGLLELGVQAIQGEYSTHWEFLFSYIMDCKIYIVSKIRTNCMLIIIVLVVLSTFKYIENTIMFWSRKYNMWSLEWFVWLYVWLGILWTVIALKYDCGFDVSYKIGNIMHMCHKSTTGYLRAIRVQFGYIRAIRAHLGFLRAIRAQLGSYVS